MYFRQKTVEGRSYLQIVESRREGKAVRQHVVATLGRVEELLETGRLDALLRSGAKLTETALVLSAAKEDAGLAVSNLRIGAPLIFERLWRESGCQAVVEAVVSERKFEFSVERAIFASVLHRLCLSGSDRGCDSWLTGYRIDGIDGLELHHFYRAMAWLGEELADQSGRTRAPRTTKDVRPQLPFWPQPTCISSCRSSVTPPYGPRRTITTTLHRSWLATATRTWSQTCAGTCAKRLPHLGGGLLNDHDIPRLIG
ncbi:MAG: hypothetical protein WCO00_14885 [Rhodospirillaceae bacterium]